MTKLLLYSLLFLTTPTVAQTLARLDAEQGFRGIKIGADADKVSGLAPDYSDMPKAEQEKVETFIYSRSNDKLLLGKVPLHGITYIVAKDETGKHIIGIMLRASKSQFFALREELKALYGNPTTNSRRLEDYYECVWAGKETTVELVSNEKETAATYHLADME